MINHIKASASGINSRGNFQIHYSRRKRNGRYVKLTFIISIVVLFFYLICKSMPVTTEQFYYQPVIVRHGDTLWRLAKDTGINMDTHRLVQKIMAYNSLVNSTILPGQTIYIPTAM